MDYTDIPDSPYMAEEDEESTAPPPELPVPIPEPAPILYNYTLDVADTALVWSYGAPLDESAIRQYLIDRGYGCTAVQAQVDETGRPTGIVTVWTDPIPPTIVVDITGGDETSAEDTETPETYIADTDVVTIPAGYTYSGDITFASEMLRDANDDPLPMIPVINGTADDVVTGEPESIGYTEISTTIAVSSLAGGTTPSFGMAFGGADTGDTLSIRNASITGTLSPDGSAVDPISPEDWAEYDGSRYTGLEATVIVWTDTAEGAIVDKPDLARLAAFWGYLESHGAEVSQITGRWNFATPDTAPTDPQITVFARQAIDPDLSDAFLYAEIDNAALDAFTVDWNAATGTSTMRRKIAGQVETPGQDDRSAPVLFYGAPSGGDVREGDLRTDDFVTYRRYTNGEWVEVNALMALNTAFDSTVTGRLAEVLAAQSTATGVRSFADQIYNAVYGYASISRSSRGTAYGHSTYIGSGSPRSGARGFEAQVPDSTADTEYAKFNNIRQVRSNGTGETAYSLQSPDGTFGKITVTDDDKIRVNGQPQDGINAVTDTATIDLTLSSGNLSADIKSGSITSAMIVDGTIAPGDLDRTYLESTKILSGTGFVDLATISGGATGVGTITVTGAAAGDVALVSASSQIESGLVFKQAWVSNTNEVSFAITNITGSSINPSPRSWYARVIKS